MTSTPPLTDAALIAWVKEERRTIGFGSRLRADILDAIAARLEQTGWQPIETAPKDGTVVLLRWSEWPRMAMTGYWLEGWAVEDKEHGHYVLRCVEPIHWMPLPAPPATSEQKP